MAGATRSAGTSSKPWLGIAKRQLDGSGYLSDQETQMIHEQEVLLGEAWFRSWQRRIRRAGCGALVPSGSVGVAGDGDVDPAEGRVGVHSKGTVMLW